MKKKVVMCLAFVALAVAPSSAQNLVVNGGFNTDLVPWTEVDGSNVLFFNTKDVKDCSSSGSGMVAHGGPEAQTAWFSQCVPIDDSLIYDMGGWIFFALAYPDSNGYFLVYWYPSTDCSGSLSSTDASDWLVGSDNPGQWISNKVEGIVPDGGTQSAKVRLSVRRIGPPPPAIPLNVHFDDVFLAPTGFLWADGFETGDTCRWSSAQF